MISKHVALAFWASLLPQETTTAFLLSSCVGEKLSYMKWNHFWLSMGVHLIVLLILKSKLMVKIEPHKEGSSSICSCGLWLFGRLSVHLSVIHDSWKDHDSHDETPSNDLNVNVVTAHQRATDSERPLSFSDEWSIKRPQTHNCSESIWWKTLMYSLQMLWFL